MDGIVALVNAAAAPAKGGLAERIGEALPGARVDRVAPGDITAAARAASGDAELVIAAGGDGTVRAVAAALTGTASALGIIPLGTLNHFARDLGIPNDLGGALGTLAAGRVRHVDTAEVNGHVFVNNSGLGLYPRIVELRQQRQRQGARKWPAFLWATLKVMALYPRLTLRVTVDGSSVERTAPIVFVGNNSYTMESLRIGTRARLDEGRLSLAIPRHDNPLRLVWASLRAALGLGRWGGSLERLDTAELVIESRRHRALPVALDGEVRTMDLPLRYTIRPGALRVVAPAPAAAASPA